ncbi:MAG TPA: hypothetical protein VF310_02115 [Vicinamibacteria bacterium]
MRRASCVMVRQIVVTAPSPGRVLVQATGQFYAAHLQGAADDTYADLATAPAVCDAVGGTHGFRRWIHPNAPATETVETGSLWRVFPVPAAGEYTFYLNAYSVGGGGAESVNGARLLATFCPD